MNPLITMFSYTHNDRTLIIQDCRLITHSKIHCICLKVPHEWNVSKNGRKNENGPQVIEYKHLHMKRNSKRNLLYKVHKTTFTVTKRLYHLIQSY